MKKAERVYGAEGMTDAPTFNPDKLIIVADKSHALYDPRAEVQGEKRAKLVASIARLGVLSPVVVRRNGVDSNGAPLVEVIDGRQRVLAAREVNRQRREVGRTDLVLVPATVRRSKNDDKAFEEMVSANIHVESDRLIEARKLAKYIEDGHDKADALVVFGLPNMRALNDMLALTDCSKQVQVAVENGEITLSVARSLSTLPNGEQNAELAALRERGETGKRSAAATKRAKAKERKVRQRAEPTYRARRASEIAMMRESIPAGRTAKIVDVLAWVLKEREAL